MSAWGNVNARQFKSPSSAQTLLKHANINATTTGVCLRTACSKGIVANLHSKAKTLQQVYRRFTGLSSQSLSTGITQRPKILSTIIKKESR